MRSALINLIPLTAAIVSVFGNIYAKNWAANHRLSFLLGAMAAYTVTAGMWLVFLRILPTLSVALPWWQAVVILPAFVIGVWYFQEKLTYLEIAAIAMILAGTVILNIKHA